MSVTQITEDELKALVDQHWFDRRTSTDNIFELIGKLIINTNEKLDLTNVKIDDLVSVLRGTSYQPTDIDDKVRPGDLGTSLAVGNENDIISCVINGLSINAIAKSIISKYETILVVPGGTASQPFVVSTSIVVKGTEDELPITFNISDVGSDIDGLKAQACNTLMYGQESSGVTHPLRVDANGSISVESNVRTLLKIDGDTYFTSALATDASENENVTISNNEITIKAINIHSLQRLNYRLWFYTKDTFLADDVIGYIDLNLPASGVSKVIGGTTYYMYSVVDVDQVYEDLDATTELHLQLENKSIASKNAGASGRIYITLIYGVNV